MSGSTQGKAPVDLPLLLSTLAIAIGGVLAIRSVVHGDPTGPLFVRKQIMGIALGFAAMAFFALNDYKILLPRFSRALSVVNVGLLLIVLKLGHSTNGAQRSRCCHTLWFAIVRKRNKNAATTC